MNHSITLNHKQSKVFQSASREVFFVGGLGMGKSFLLGLWLLNKLRYKNALGLLVAPTNVVLRTATFPQVKDCWDKVGLVEGKDYFINIRPPDGLGIEVFSKLSSDKIITFAWGAYLIVGSADNPNSFRGVEADCVAVDEMRDIKEAARDILVGRLRGKCYSKLGKKHQILYATTPPDNPVYLDKLSKKQDDELAFIFGTTYDNEANLPQGYISSLKSKYDLFTFQREVLGMLVFNRGKTFAYAFDPMKHVSEAAKYSPTLPIYLSFDFNVNPAVCTLWQHSHDFIHLIDEVRIENADIYKVCETILRMYPTAKFNVTGDATGQKREFIARDNENAYQVIKKLLRVGRNSYNTPASNPSVRGTYTLINSIFSHYPKIFINPKCEHTTYDLQMVVMDDSGNIDKKTDSKISHLLDTVRYYLSTYHTKLLKTTQPTPNPTEK